jgi:flagellar motility protein MotE (MotC chaperone)
MIRYVRELRLIPIAVIASACLLALKAADLLLDRDAPTPAERALQADAEATVVHAAPGVPKPSDPHRSWAQQMFNFPDSSWSAPARTDVVQLPAIAPVASDRSNLDIITGSVADNSDDKSKQAKSGATDAAGKEGKEGKEGTPPNAGKDNKPANAGRENQNAAPPGKVILTDGKSLPSPAERAILERLSERRQELEKRARELDIREGLIAEAEKRMDAKLSEIKEGEAQLVTAAEKKDEAEAARFKGLVTMYENMKPRDAAKIFDRLEISVLIEVASQINPRRMSDILAQMSPETAERLTVELANRAKAVAKPGAELPKIEGRPTTP